MEAVLAAVSAPIEERTDDEVELLSRALLCVPVLATMPQESRLRLCAVASYEQYEEFQIVLEPPAEDSGSRAGNRAGGLGSGSGSGSGTDTGVGADGRCGLCVTLFGTLTVCPRLSRVSHAEQTLKPGDHFGENALLHKVFRGTTIRANERCGLLVISEADLRKELRRSELEQAAEKAVFVTSVPMFAKLPWERLLRMVHLLQHRSYTHGEVIVAQDDTPQGLYILYEGRCTVSRTMTYLENGRRLKRSMHLETLMPRDTFGGDAVLHGLMRSRTTLLAETDVSLFFMPRADFSPSHLTEEALRMLKLNAKLYRPNDELLLQRHYQEMEWARAKQHYVKGVIKQAREKKTLDALMSRNPSTMKRSGAAGPVGP